MTGTYAEFVKVKEGQLAPLPKELSFEDGAALGIPYMTAYRGLVTRAGVKKGEKVLVHGASGGTGVATVQIAKGLGCTVIGTAGTEEGIAVVKKAGTCAIWHSMCVNRDAGMEFHSYCLLCFCLNYLMCYFVPPIVYELLHLYFMFQ